MGTMNEINMNFKCLDLEYVSCEIFNIDFASYKKIKIFGCLEELENFNVVPNLKFLGIVTCCKL